jgi:hypothetical protein
VPEGGLLRTGKPALAMTARSHFFMALQDDGGGALAGCRLVSRRQKGCGIIE